MHTMPAQIENLRFSFEDIANQKNQKVALSHSNRQLKQDSKSSKVTQKKVSASTHHNITPKSQHNFLIGATDFPPYTVNTSNLIGSQIVNDNVFGLN